MNNGEEDNDHNLLFQNVLIPKAIKLWPNENNRNVRFLPRRWLDDHDITLCTSVFNETNFNRHNKFLCASIVASISDAIREFVAKHDKSEDIIKKYANGELTLDKLICQMISNSLLECCHGNIQNLIEKLACVLCPVNMGNGHWSLLVLYRIKPPKSSYYFWNHHIFDSNPCGDDSVTRYNSIFHHKDYDWNAPMCGDRDHSSIRRFCQTLKAHLHFVMDKFQFPSTITDALSDDEELIHMFSRTLYSNTNQKLFSFTPYELRQKSGWECGYFVILMSWLISYIVCHCHQPDIQMAFGALMESEKFKIPSLSQVIIPEMNNRLLLFTEQEKVLIVCLEKHNHKLLTNMGFISQ